MPCANLDCESGHSSSHYDLCRFCRAQPEEDIRRFEMPIEHLFYRDWLGLVITLNPRVTRPI